VQAGEQLDLVVTGFLPENKRKLTRRGFAAFETKRILQFFKGNQRHRFFPACDLRLHLLAVGNIFEHGVPLPQDFAKL